MFFGLFKLQPHCDPLLAVIGFFVYLASYIIISVYIVWALLPTHLLETLGFTYYPQKYWALLIPVWPCVLLLFLYTVVSLQTVIRCPDFNDSRVYKDQHTDTSEVIREGEIPALRDLNILDVSDMLYN